MALKTQLGILLLASLCCAQTALACEDPDNTVFATRTQASKVVAPGDILLELDVDSMVEFAAPRELDRNGNASDFPQYFARFTVLRVLVGAYELKHATIMLSDSNCWNLGVGRFLLAGPPEDFKGIAYLPARVLTFSELRALSPSHR